MTNVLIHFRRWLRRDWLALLMFVIAAAVSIYPVLPAVRWHVIGWPGDNVQYVYMTGWVAEALRTGQFPLLDPHLNYPGQLWLPATDAPFLSMVLVAPFAWLFTPTLAYNVILFVSSFASGYFTYLWLYRVTGSRFAGWVSGLSFLLSPYRIVHSYGHLQLISTQFIPLFFWALDQVLQREKSTEAHGGTQRSTQNPQYLPSVSLRGSKKYLPLLALAGATALVGAMSQYYLVICAITGAAYALLSGLPWRAYVQRGWQWALAIGAGGLLSAWPYLLTARDVAYTGYSIEETRIWSANPLDFIMPSRLHPLWGSVMEQLYPRATWIEHTLYVGLIALGLALLGLVYRRQYPHPHPHPPSSPLDHSGVANPSRGLWRWAGVALFALILALGTDLHVGMENHALQPTQPVWLPTYYLAHLPGISFMRTWSRFGIITVFFVSALAGVGAGWVWSRSRGMGLLCLALLCLDVAPGRIVHFTLRPRAIDIWLAQQPVPGAVAMLPAGASNYDDMYGSLNHARAMPAYNHPTHLPAEFRQFAQATHQFPDAASLVALRQMDLRYIIVNRTAFDGIQAPKWPDIAVQLAQQQQLQQIAEIDQFTVFVWR